MLRSVTSKTEVLQLHIEGLCNHIIYSCNKQSLPYGISIHSPILKHGFQDNLYLNNNLLSLYSKCCGLNHARHFFDEMPYKDVVSWTTMLSSYTKQDRHLEALGLFNFMAVSGECPNEYTLSSLLSSCSALHDFSYGRKIHGLIVKYGLDEFPFLSTSLVNLYASCGYVEESCKLVENVDVCDTVTWNTMISAYVQGERYVEALEVFCCMIKEKVRPDERTFVKVLGASAALGIQFGKLIHAQLMVWGAQLNLILKTALVDMYAKCKRMEDAVKVSDQTSEHDVYLWTSIISGFSQCSRFQKAIEAFQQMIGSGVSPNNYTYAGITNACSSTGALQLGKQIHSQVIVAGLEDDTSVGNAMIDMYMKCSATIQYALQVFGRVKFPNVISWTSLIAGLAKNGLAEESFKAFEEMRSVGQVPNPITLSVIFQACRSTKFSNQIKRLHGYSIKANASHDTIVGNALVNAYAGSGMVDNACAIFRSMNHRDAITYTSLASNLNHVGHHELALDVIKEMHKCNIIMDGFSLATCLAACAGSGAIQTGKQFHSYSIKTGLENCLSVSNCLIDFYGKCRQIKDAQKIFAGIHEPDVVSWNSLIIVMVWNGNISSALSAFEDMKLAGSRPDSVTLLALLFACTRHGLVDMGLDFFQSMRETYDIVPELNHYVCLVDLLGRSGRLEEAVCVIDTMSLEPSPEIYKTLLGACRLHRNIPLGEDIARKGLELAPNDPTLYVLLGQMYDDAGRYDLSEQIHTLMRNKGLGKFCTHVSNKRADIYFSG